MSICPTPETASVSDTPYRPAYDILDADQHRVASADAFEDAMLFSRVLSAPWIIRAHDGAVMMQPMRDPAALPRMRYATFGRSAR